MKKPTRALRRHHAERRKRWVQRELGDHLCWAGDDRERSKLLGRLAETPKPCSCWMCGNPRRYGEGKPFREVRATPATPLERFE